MITVKRGLVVFSDDPALWKSGEEIALRVSAHSLPVRLPITLIEAEATILTLSGQILHESTLSQGLEGMWQGSIRLPDAVGQYRLQVSAKGREHAGVTGGEQQAPVNLSADRIIQLNKTRVDTLWPEPAITPETAVGRQGAGDIAFYPADQEATTELVSKLFIITQNEDGTPWSGTLNLALTEGILGQKITQSIEVSSQGLGKIDVIPRSLQFTLQASGVLSREAVDSEYSEASKKTVTTERMIPKPHQFVLTASKQLVRVGDRVKVIVKSSRTTKRLHVDLWTLDRWLSAQLIHMNTNLEDSTKSGARAQGDGIITIPRLSALSSNQPLLLWVQSYLVPYQIDDVRGGQYLLALPNEMSELSGVHWLKKHLIDAKIEPRAYWSNLSDQDLLNPDILRFALGRLERPSTSPKLLINSGESARVTAEAQQQYYFQQFFKAMATLCIVTMTWLLVIGRRQYTQRLNSSDWMGPEEQARLKWSIVGWILPSLLMLGVFFAAMMFLVTKLSW